jgi:hypothetical protein
MPSFATWQTKCEIPRGDEDEEHTDDGGAEEDDAHGVFDEARCAPCLHKIVDEQRQRRAHVDQADQPQNGVADPGAHLDAHLSLLTAGLKSYIR